MKFIVEYGNPVEHRLLTYIPEECSFYMEPTISKIDFELILNKLSLSVIDNKIIQLSGFCGLDQSMKSDYQLPVYKEGTLSVKDNLKFGFAYSITDEDLSVYLNTQTGWVCIGDPERSGNAVEFINSCVAVIGYNKELVSLWLKPQALPNI